MAPPLNPKVDCTVTADFTTFPCIAERIARMKTFSSLSGLTVSLVCHVVEKTDICG
jgi:hypothetical protein